MHLMLSSTREIKKRKKDDEDKEDEGITITREVI